MCKEVALSVDMEKLDNIFVADNSATACLRERLGRNDLPVVISVIMAVTGDLLT